MRTILIMVWSFEIIHLKAASGMIKLLAGSCLSELWIVLKEPTAIYNL
jgi:hypothetical protein